MVIIQDTLISKCQYIYNLNISLSELHITLNHLKRLGFPCDGQIIKFMIRINFNQTRIQTEQIEITSTYHIHIHHFYPDNRYVHRRTNHLVYTGSLCPCRKLCSSVDTYNDNSFHHHLLSNPLHHHKSKILGYTSPSCYTGFGVLDMLCSLYLIGINYSVTNLHPQKIQVVIDTGC